MSQGFSDDARAFHGGQFWEWIGPDFADLARRTQMINADVLDAWFPPSPQVLAAVSPHLEWLMRTSPPTESEGLRRAIAQARGVPVESVLPGPGSSSLIFGALRLWARAGQTALVLEPTYGEYRHVLENLVQAQVLSHRLSPSEDFGVRTDELIAQAAGADLVVIVNPNSPNGGVLPHHELIRVADSLRPTTTLWVDETYVDYALGEPSFEAEACRRGNVVVVKSMSKVYALSGLRIGYLVGSPERIQGVARWSPPWSVDLVAQAAATVALEERDYYRDRWAETRTLRERLRIEIEGRVGWRAFPSQANFLLFQLPDDGPDAFAYADQAEAQGLFLRTFPSGEGNLGSRFVRLAVKSADEQDRMLAILGSIT